MVQGGLILSDSGSFQYILPSLLNKEDEIIAGFSTRCGGVSDGSYSSLNLDFHTGDDKHNVLSNREIFFSKFGLKPENLVAGNQVHGTRVHMVKEDDIGKGSQPQTALPECDAMITNIPGPVLSVFSADCWLVCFVDAQKKVIAVAHAGWRGILKGIVEKVIGTFSEKYQCNPDNLKAAVGPGICFKCFEVGKEVADEFKQKGWSDSACLVSQHNSDKYFLNLKEILARQLLNNGMQESNIEFTKYCTFCRPDLFYSYRRDGSRTGRILGFVSIRE